MPPDLPVGSEGNFKGQTSMAEHGAQLLDPGFSSTKMGPQVTPVHVM